MDMQEQLRLYNLICLMAVEQYGKNGILFLSEQASVDVGEKLIAAIERAGGKEVSATVGRVTAAGGVFLCALYGEDQMKKFDAEVGQLIEKEKE